jgi:tetratricopeptide (TPR) repeat protein
MTTTPVSHLWINRQEADKLFEEICAKPSGVTIYLINAPAGVGKTYLARDIGVRLGSETGYEAGHKDDLYWSGIIDLYDPDTNSKRIERRWIEAFGSLTGFEFEEYKNKRDFYDLSAAKAATASDLEKQVNEIRSAFAEGMEESIKEHYPVMAFDTIERLQTILDPAQQKLGIQAIERPDILVWLLHQLPLLSHGYILMVGRLAPALTKELELKVDEINPERKKNGLQPITLRKLSLEYLTKSEQEDFFQHRITEHPRLKHLLDIHTKSLLVTHTKGNPLLLDIAIQTLLVDTVKRGDVEEALKSPKGIKAVEEALLSAYMNSGSSDVRNDLLIHLAIARNGLFEELLKHLDEARFPELQHELTKMEDLPFVKVREILASDPSKGQSRTQRTYFLHDEMYEICDRVGLVLPEQVREDSKKIVDWYDAQVEQHPKTEGRIPDEIKDLLIESLPYRMRSDPQKAYRWFLEQSDKAIRSAERGLDMRLQGSMAQFMSGARDKDQSGDLPSNAIDREILRVDAPRLQKDFEIDSTLLWLKRFSTRSQHEQALAIANKATWIENTYKTDPDRYLITYAEFLLWKGQSLMYIGKSEEAMTIYNQALARIKTRFSFEQLESLVKSKETLTADDSRICYVFGRLYNNLGYVYWYQGKYWLAIDEFNEALRYFKLADLVEEIANSEDNMGRVYATLGYNFQAFEQIGDGLKLRITAGSPYREALSRNSLAIIYFRFNNATRALEEIEAALKIFERFEVERGIALAHFTRGVAYRRLTREVESWQNPILTKDQAIRYIEQAENDLLRALRIFSDSVQEPIRKIQIYNELACVFRARYLLLKSKNDHRQDEAFKRSKSCFDLAIDLADKGGFPIPGLDSLQDRAVLYTYAKQYYLAKLDIDKLCKKIPEEYQIKKEQGLSSLGDNEQRVDAYYRFMGQVEELRATIVYEEALLATQSLETTKQANLLDMLEHFTLASAYFNVFSSEAFLQQQTHSHIYAKLRGSPEEFILNIREKYLPTWLEEYNLPAEPISSQFDGIFNALLPGNKKWGQSSRQ